MGRWEKFVGRFKKKTAEKLAKPSADRLSEAIAKAELALKEVK